MRNDEAYSGLYKTAQDIITGQQTAVIPTVLTNAIATQLNAQPVTGLNGTPPDIHSIVIEALKQKLYGYDQSHSFLVIAPHPSNPADFILKDATDADKKLYKASAFHCDLGGMKHALEKEGANPNVVKRSFGNNYSPLYWAIHYGDPNAVKLLLEHGASPNYMHTRINPAEDPPNSPYVYANSSIKPRCAELISNHPAYIPNEGEIQKYLIERQKKWFGEGKERPFEGNMNALQKLVHNWDLFWATKSFQTPQRSSRAL